MHECTCTVLCNIILCVGQWQIQTTCCSWLQHKMECFVLESTAALQPWLEGLHLSSLMVRGFSIIHVHMNVSHSLSSPKGQTVV